MSLPIFPDIPTMAWNSIKRQRWNTKVQKSGSGIRKSLSRWAYAEWDIEAEYTCLNQDQIELVAGFIGLVRGQFKPFLWKDPEDFKQTKVRIGTGNGINTDFQLLRNLGNLYIEPVKDIVAGTLAVCANDTEIPVTLGTDGLVKANTAPETGAIVTASFEYYWRVAFADDEADWTNFWYNYYKLNKIKLVTVK